MSTDSNAVHRVAPAEAMPNALTEPQSLFLPVFTSIRKRNGEVVPFNADKITAALVKAGQSTGEIDETAAKHLTLRILSLAQTCIAQRVPDVEEIQDLVEEVLLASPFKRTAKAYILYREQHARIRQMVEQADLDLVDSYLDRLDWQVRENSNMGYSLQGLNNYISSSVSQVYWLNKLYPRELRDAHLSGDLHVHDLSQLSVYCVGWDLQDLLLHGFKGAPNKAESRPAKHFRAALGQIVNFFYTLQGEAAGAQAFANLDTLLAPLIRYDDLPFKEVKQALQEFVFNLNVATRVGFQTPFTNVTLDLQPPSHLAAQQVVIGGRYQDATYGEFGPEMALFNRALLEVLAEGDAKGRVFTFPIPTYNITKDFDWDNENLAPLWEATARYGIPYFANFVNSDMSPDDARSMCCRLRLDIAELRRRGGGLFGASPLTGSIGVVTINLPRLGFLAEDRDDFLQRLDRLMDIARVGLEVKTKILETLTDKGLYPYTSFYLRSMKQRTGLYWPNHFCTVGLVGMEEACRNLLNCGIGCEEGQAFAVHVLTHMRERLQDYQRETGLLFNLEATPAEGASHRLARLDLAKFSGIQFANTASVQKGAAPFYTNSSHLPVNYTDDPFEALDLQDELQCQYTGGTVLHFYLGEALSDPEAVKHFVRTVCERYRLPYFTLSPTFSICAEHGYVRGGVPECPECGRETEVYSRIVGYLRPVSQWNEGKLCEYEMRRTFALETV
jgi:ribonucleoside-triphosphate reductase